LGRLSLRCGCGDFRALFLPTLYVIAIVIGTAMLSRYFLQDELSTGFYFSQFLVYLLVVVPGRLSSAKSLG
jgi:hypothetical protein